VRVLNNDKAKYLPVLASTLTRELYSKWIPSALPKPRESIRTPTNHTE